MITDNRAAIIIPAFNEAERIAPVIEAVQGSDDSLIRTNEVIVVDNNSTDCTAKVAVDMGALVISCEEQGKAPALEVGVECARSLGAHVISYFDADLVNLRPVHVDLLIHPVLDEEALMTIGFLGGRSEFLKSTIYRRWAMFSGQRALPITVWDKLGDRDLKAFRVEAALNSLFRNSSRGDEIKRIELDGVTHTGKFDKYPFGRAMMQYARIELSAIYGLTTRSSL